ncbi:hypothetical protein [Fischerella sp. JS2]|uniref:hypothetical protein n=1 Tax=Fischerella sp. JS2 TaxID=2597771 RepID=UPI0028EBA731|nr:hypothetical protein [Fischerella sp. JS2]
MNQQLWDSINWALGLGVQPKTLTFLQMALRAIIYICSRANDGTLVRRSPFWW